MGWDAVHLQLPVAGPVDSDISGATGSTYTLADADESKTVTVRVSFTDEGGNARDVDQ